MKSFATLEKCAEQFAADLGAHLKEAIALRGQASLAVSGGRTPQHLFPVLARQRVDWERLSITLADERWVDADHPDSNEGLARRLLMRGPAAAARFVGIKTQHQNPLDGQAQVNAALATLDWPLDAIYLGMGEDGHIASLFPDLDTWQDAAGLALAVPGSEKRQARMTLTPAALLNCRHIFLVICGPQKRATYDAALKPGPPGQYPVRLIIHQNRVRLSLYAVD